MATNTDPNKDYLLMAPELESVRDAVLGAFFVKRKSKYLPHPSQVDTTSQEQTIRYSQYVAGAEFPEFTKSTLVSMIGKMQISDTSVDLNAKISYLEGDSDGDGLSLTGLMESCASNVLQAKWHVLLADYKGLSEVDLSSVSIADKEQLNPRATINQYSRENVIDWAFGRVNGRMQLIYILLREKGETVDIATGNHSDVESFLKLAIDDDGYYQQKIVKGDGGINQEGEINRVIVGGSSLKFIPISIISDSEINTGKMPLDTGYLTGIADLAYFRYRVSASYKEALSDLLPTLNVFGMSDNDWAEFKEVNGRDYLGAGSKCPNVFGPADARVEILEPDMSLEQFEKYFDRNEKMVRALGGVFNTDATVQRTATEVMNEATTQTDVLDPLVSSIESGVKTMILYCGMFEGIYQVNNIQSNLDDFEVVMPRDFAVSKLTFNEVKTYIELFGSGLMSQDEILKVLELGGWTVSDAEQIGLEIQNSGPNVTDITDAP